MAGLFNGLKKKSYKVSSTLSFKGTIQLNLKPTKTANIVNLFTNAINDATILIARDLKEALDQAMLSDNWDTLSGKNNIYDTGELLDSGTVTISGTNLIIAYSAPYATLVHYGGYVLPYGRTDIEKVYLPPRPWIDAVVRGNGPVAKFDFESYYRKQIQNAFR